MSTCDVCDSRFRVKKAASQHKKATGHCVCEHCGKICGTSNGLKVHKIDTHCNKCPQCSLVFDFKETLKNHQRKKQHCYCGDCDRPFTSSNALASHLQSSEHSTEFRCCDCNRPFKSSKALNDHLRDKTHSRRQPQPAVTSALQGGSREHLNKCPRCSKKFKTSAAMQTHLKSLAHCPLSNLRCIGSPCEKRFSSPSALLLHLESGACPSGMNHEKVKSLVLKFDTERLITEAPMGFSSPILNASAELGKAGRQSTISDSDSGSEVLIETPSTLSPICRTPSDISISEWALLVSPSSNRQCTFCSRKFGSAAALQNHLSSPAHQEPFVFCPTNLAIDSKKDSKTYKAFKTVSGLAQHLESGACYGGLDGFQRAVRFVEEHVKRWGLNISLTISNH